MSASVEHTPRGKVYVLNYVEGSGVSAVIHKIPYGILTVAQGNCHEFLQAGICAWVEPIEDSVEYANIVDQWLYNQKHAG